VQVERIDLLLELWDDRLRSNYKLVANFKGLWYEVNEGAFSERMELLLEDQSLLIKGKLPKLLLNMNLFKAWEDVPLNLAVDMGVHTYHLLGHLVRILVFECDLLGKILVPMN